MEIGTSKRQKNERCALAFSVQANDLHRVEVKALLGWCSIGNDGSIRSYPFERKWQLKYSS